MEGPPALHSLPRSPEPGVNRERGWRADHAWPLRWGLRGALLLAFTLLILGILAWRTDVRRIWASLVSARWELVLVMALISLPINVVMAADKFMRILRFGHCRISLGESMFIRLASAPLKLVLPGKAGEAAKAFYLKRRSGLPLTTGLGAILFDKATNLVAALILLLSLTYWYATPAVSSRYYLFALILVLVFLFLHRLPAAGRWGSRLPARVKSSLARLTETFTAAGPRGRLGFIIYSMVFEFSEIANTYLALRALGVPIPMIEAVALVPIIILAGNLPLTIAGLGTREAAFVLLYSPWAQPGVLVSAGLLVSFIEYIMVSIIGLLFLPRFLAAMTPPSPGSGQDSGTD